MLKKTICGMLVVLALAFGAGAAQTAFPAERTGADGIARYGYLDESGMTVLPFAYAKAGEFADCGLAAVEDDKWRTAVIDRTGKLVVPYTEAPVSVDFSDDAIAYRYADRSVYYTLGGEPIGSYAGAEGFFSDGLLACKSPASGLYNYLKPDGTAAFAGDFKAAGAFSGGLALVQTAAHEFRVIDTAGETRHLLDTFATPAYLTIYGGDTIVMQDGVTSALYSLSQGAYLTEFLYNQISEFHDGVAMVRQVNRWGLINTAGRLLTPPTYYYLGYMGEGLYAARSEDGSAAAVDASGNIIYRTPEYIGGFSELHYGLSWHGTADGSIIFFRKSGGYAASLPNAEKPTLLTENVVRVTQDGALKYINLATGETVYAPPRSFDLGGGLTATTVTYEKFLGYQKDGTEHGWNVTFPEISGLPDAAVQKEINSAIRSFFLKGPSVTAEYEALEGGYGVSIEGSVLVVSASCISGKGSGASVWNNSLAFDLRSGKQYVLTDLMRDNYLATVRALLPEEHAIYLYSFPRLSAKGVTYYYNEYENESRRAYTESYLLSFSDLGDAVNRDSACFAALQTHYVRPNTVAAFTDVPAGHWAEAIIREAAKQGLMQGDGGKFRPEQSITYAEMCATIARSRKLPPAETMPDTDAAAWYAGELGAVYAAGLLRGMEERFDPAAAVSREDAMQLFANVLLADGKAPVTEAAAVLKDFSDTARLAPDRLSAAALCVREGLVQGANGRLNPTGILTRAEFAKLLLLL